MQNRERFVLLLKVNLHCQKMERVPPLPLQKTNCLLKVDQLPTIFANPVLMKSLFLNLIGNAMKYSKPNVPPVIKVYCDNTAIEQKTTGGKMQAKYHRIYIRDNGIGFDQKYAEQIFDMFKRLHVHTEYEGTGIGLALCKQIMEKHNGYISAVSAENEGSTFIISLPVNKEAIPALN